MTLPPLVFPGLSIVDTTYLVQTKAEAKSHCLTHFCDMEIFTFETTVATYFSLPISSSVSRIEALEMLKNILERSLPLSLYFILFI